MITRKVYIVGTYTETYSDSWIYCRAFSTRKKAEEWIEKDKKDSKGENERVTYEIVLDEVEFEEEAA